MLDGQLGQSRSTGRLANVAVLPAECHRPWAVLSLSFVLMLCVRLSWLLQGAYKYGKMKFPVFSRPCKQSYFPLQL